MPLCAVLLDIDGTLVDSSEQHARSWCDVLSEAGRDVPPVAEVRRLIGMGGDQILLRLASDLSPESDAGQRIRQRCSELFHERHLPEVKPFPAVRDLLLRMRERGLRLIVASSARRENVDHLLQIAGVADLIEDAVSGTDVKRSKPAPDIVEAALKKSGCPADSVLMLGDTPYDIEAARPVGVGVVALRCGGHGCWTDAEFSGAVAIYNDPSELLQQFDTSPFSQQIR